jgi:hypothetical protein
MYIIIKQNRFYLGPEIDETDKSPAPLCDILS